MKPIVDLQQVEKVYPGPVPVRALSDVTLAFEEGGFSSIIGASGSGKTTLMNVIGTLDRPTRGEVSIAGESTSRMGKNRLAELRNRQIGFVFQFHYLLPEFTVLENVLMPRLIADGRIAPAARRRAEELLDLVGLSDIVNKPSTKISGGQQQRTAIARALANDPSIVLADEPTGNLDSETTDRIYRLLREINEELGTTFVIVTHDRTVAERTDRVVEIRDGTVATDLRR